MKKDARTISAPRFSVRWILSCTACKRFQKRRLSTLHNNHRKNQNSSGNAHARFTSPARMVSKTEFKFGHPKCPKLQPPPCHRNCPMCQKRDQKASVSRPYVQTWACEYRTRSPWMHYKYQNSRKESKNVVNGCISWSATAQKHPNLHGSRVGVIDSPAVNVGSLPCFVTTIVQENCITAACPAFLCHESVIFILKQPLQTR